jgi:hypothetical protein
MPVNTIVQLFVAMNNLLVQLCTVMVTVTAKLLTLLDKVIHQPTNTTPTTTTASHPLAIATTAATDVHEPTPTKKAKSSLFGHWSSSTDKVVKSDSPAQQLRQFLNCINSDAFVYEETNEILARNEYCLLRPLFSHVFCIPATSAPIERIFSQSGLVISIVVVHISSDIQCRRSVTVPVSS